MANPRIIAAAIAAISVPLVSFVTVWEGTEFVPYKDIAGIWTVCQGITGPGVIPGRTYSRNECRAMLDGALKSHAIGLAKCIIHEPPPPQMLSALISWTFNVGVGAACKSTLVRLVNQGQFEAACHQLLRWNKVGQKEVQGLTNRRKAEWTWCLEGLK